MVFVTSGRRVSFDLSHNTVHVLPSFEECRDEAKRIRREEWQRKTLNEEMLSEDIIVEIQEDSCLYARSAEMPEKLSAVELKSCLKKKEALSEDPDNKRKKHPKKNNQKKRKRSYSKSTIDKGKHSSYFDPNLPSHPYSVNMISVH